MGKKRKNYDHLIGRKFDKLKVRKVKFCEVTRLHECEVTCECGTMKVIKLKYLLWGGVKSCGCLSGKQTKHGLCVGVYGNKEIKTPNFYNIWTRMLQSARGTRNKKRGLSKVYVKKDWFTFNNFYKEMYPKYEKALKDSKGQKIYFNRIDVDKGFDDSNCIFSTKLSSSYNSDKYRKIKYKGKKYLQTELAKEVGLTSSLISSRLRRGYSVEEMISKEKHICVKRKHDIGVFKSWKEVSDHLGISKQRVFQLIEKWGIPAKEAIKIYEKRNKK